MTRTVEEVGIVGRAALRFWVDGQTGKGQGWAGSSVSRWDEQTVCPQWRVNGLRRSGRGAASPSTAQRGQERRGRRRLSGMGDGWRWERNAS